jgi:hypothetical protein
MLPTRTLWEGGGKGRERKRKGERKKKTLLP